MLTVSSFLFSFWISHASMHRNTQILQHTDSLCKYTWGHTQKSAAQLSWYGVPCFTVCPWSLFLRKRQPIRDRLCGRECTSIDKPQRSWCMIHFRHTNLFPTRVAQALQWNLICKKNHLSLFYIPLRRQGPCSRTIHPDKWVCICSTRRDSLTEKWGLWNVAQRESDYLGYSSWVCSLQKTCFKVIDDIYTVQCSGEKIKRRREDYFRGEDEAWRKEKKGGMGVNREIRGRGKEKAHVRRKGSRQQSEVGSEDEDEEEETGRAQGRHQWSYRSVRPVHVCRPVTVFPHLYANMGWISSL